MPLPGIPPWTDQDIELYHGTLDVEVVSVLSGIDLRACKHLRDFGRGFYTTTNLSKAQSWANDKSLQSSGAAPAVIRFIVQRNDLAGLDRLFSFAVTPMRSIFGASFSILGTRPEIITGSTRVGMTLSRGR